MVLQYVFAELKGNTLGQDHLNVAVNHVCDLCTARSKLVCEMKVAKASTLIAGDEMVAVKSAKYPLGTSEPKANTLLEGKRLTKLGSPLGPA